MKDPVCRPMIGPTEAALASAEESLASDQELLRELDRLLGHGRSARRREWHTHAPPRILAGKRYLTRHAVVDALRRAQNHLFSIQRPDGHWVGELKVDVTLAADFILYCWFMGTRSERVRQIEKAAAHIVREQLPGGGWSIYPGGPANISASVKAYFALKLAGHRIHEPHMRRARQVILSLGGVAKANSYVKIYLCFFGQYDWECAPAIPPEVVLFPRFFPFNIYEMSSWSRTILVPLSILWALKPYVPVPRDRGIDELFPEGRNPYAMRLPRDKKLLSWRNFFLLTDRALHMFEKAGVTPLRRRALRVAERWIRERLPKSGGLSAIFPAMLNTIFAFKCLGYPEDEPMYRESIRQFEDLIIEEPDDFRMQPCFSPVWDTGLTAYCLQESGIPPDHPGILRAARWLVEHRVRHAGDWKVKNRRGQPGGWYFEYANEYYPDVDDTAMVLMALRRISFPDEAAERERREAVDRGLKWLLSMQNRDGGWASFDQNNDMVWLTHVPFADHNAIIDPSTSDITARSLEMLAQYGYTKEHPICRRALTFLAKDQQPDGSWFGRWGVNYIYGTWQVLTGLSRIGMPLDHPMIRRGVEWLLSVQNADGGWGETCRSYDDPAFKGKGPSTASQTAWATLGLMAAGERNNPHVKRGIQYLVRTQNEDGSWDEPEFTGTGFPCVFYLKYDMYRLYFPAMALGRYLRQA